MVRTQRAPILAQPLPEIDVVVCLITALLGTTGKNFLLDLLPQSWRDRRRWTHNQLPPVWPHFSLILHDPNVGRRIGMGAKHS